VEVFFFSWLVRFAVSQSNRQALCSCRTGTSFCCTAKGGKSVPKREGTPLARAVSFPLWNLLSFPDALRDLRPLRILSSLGLPVAAGTHPMPARCKKPRTFRALPGAMLRMTFSFLCLRCASRKRRVSLSADSERLRGAAPKDEQKKQDFLASSLSFALQNSYPYGILDAAAIKAKVPVAAGNAPVVTYR